MLCAFPTRVTSSLSFSRDVNAWPERSSPTPSTFRYHLRQDGSAVHTRAGGCESLSIHIPRYALYLRSSAHTKVTSAVVTNVTLYLFDMTQESEIRQGTHLSLNSTRQLRSVQALVSP